MGKRIFAAIIATLIFLTIGGCSNDNGNIEINNTDETDVYNRGNNEAEEEIITPNYTLNMSEEIWTGLNTENIRRFQSKEDFIGAVEYYIKAISEFVSRENWFDYYNRYGSICRIEILMTDGISRVTVSNVYRVTVYLRQAFFEYDLAPIAHEIAHVVIPWRNRSRSLSEGLASYLQDRFGKNPTIFNWGIDPHTIANLYMNNASEAFGTHSVYADGALRPLFYNMSNSFVTYLIDTFGIANFMSVFESDNLIDAYYIYFGKPFEDIREDWLGFLESYQDLMTLEEYSNYLVELFTRHNFPLG